MDGKYPSDSYSFTEKEKALINHWIQNAIDNRSWEKHLDLHVDEICQKGRYKKYWIPLSISLVHHANQLLQKIGAPGVIAIVDIVLRVNEEFHIGFPFQQLDNVHAALDVPPPPSLSIYSKQSAELSNVYQDAVSLGELLIGTNRFNVIAYETLLRRDYTQHIRVINLIPAEHNIQLGNNIHTQP